MTDILLLTLIDKQGYLRVITRDLRAELEHTRTWLNAAYPKNNYEIMTQDEFNRRILKTN